MSTDTYWDDARAITPTVIGPDRKADGEPPEDRAWDDFTKADEHGLVLGSTSGNVHVFTGTGQELYDLAAKLVELAAPLREHADATPPGHRTPYDGSTGEFIARCNCKREFRHRDADGAEWLLGAHLEDPTLDDAAVLRQMES